MDYFLIDTNTKRITSLMNYSPDPDNLPSELALKEAQKEHIDLFHAGYGMYDLENNTPVKSSIQSRQELQTFLLQNMNAVLNTVAVSYGYSNFNDALTYMTSQNADFKAHAEELSAKRDTLRAAIMVYVNSMPFEFNVFQEEALSAITW